MKASPFRRFLHHGWRVPSENQDGVEPISTQPFRLGIVARLGMAFAAVGALVMAANFIVETGVLVERTTLITRTIALATPRAVPPVVAPMVSEPKSMSVAAPPRSVTSEALRERLGRFDDAVLDRVSSNTVQTVLQTQRSIGELNSAGKEFLTTATAISGRSFSKLGAALTSHQQQGQALVFASDARHDMLVKYAVLFEALNARDKAALDHSWKIFGRVLARQSLLQLSADLDTLRRHAAAVVSDRGDPLEVAALQQAEQSVRKRLNDNQASLRKSEGGPWYEAMTADCAALVAMHADIDQASEQLRIQSKAFSDDGARLVKTIPPRVESLSGAPRASAEGAPPRLVTLLKTAVPAAPSPAAVSMAATVPVETATIQPATAALNTAAAPTPQVETHSIVRESPDDRSKRIQIAWISAGSLILLTYVLISTVLSIVRPVRRLLRATAAIAGGDTSARVERGGIKELDTVAVAFNLMAEELAAARAAAHDYQHSLERKVIERTLELQDLAEHDPLTGLPNRREWFSLLHAALARAGETNERVGVFFLDVDNFKFINDSAGHAFGDRVLVSMSERLRATTQAFGFCARLGGDEFTVVYAGAACNEDIERAGMSIVQAFQQPLTVDGREIIVSVSVGASIYPQHERDAEALLKAADVALFRAKELGRGRLVTFTPGLLEAASAKFTTEQGLRRAIERGEFELAFQPEINAQTLETSLVEALIRWRTPGGILLMPGNFLAIAEESGLILEIGDWVLRSAIEAAAHWHHGVWPDVRVAINVSPRQFSDAGFIDRLLSLLQTNRLPARCIEIELTESVLQTGTATIDALKRLRAHGVAIALDDFGTGYSSLASLEQLPLTRIKLDRALIADIDSSPRSAAIANAIITLCHGLGLDITAEGIERPAQFALLRSHRGMHLQGFLLAHPTSRDELIPALAVVSQRCQELLLTTQPYPATANRSNVVEMPRAALRAWPDAG